MVYSFQFGLGAGNNFAYGKWSRLKLTYEMFSQFAVDFTFAPSAMEITSTLGYRRSDTDGHFTACFSRRHRNSFKESHDIYG